MIMKILDVLCIVRSSLVYSSMECVNSKHEIVMIMSARVGMTVMSYLSSVTLLKVELEGRERIVHRTLLYSAI